jgi:hypothetical protein
MLGIFRKQKEEQEPLYTSPTPREQVAPTEKCGADLTPLIDAIGNSEVTSEHIDNSFSCGSFSKITLVFNGVVEVSYTRHYHTWGGASVSSMVFTKRETSPQLDLFDSPTVVGVYGGNHGVYIRPDYTTDNQFKRLSSIVEAKLAESRTRKLTDGINKIVDLFGVPVQA